MIHFWISSIHKDEDIIMVLSSPDEVLQVLLPALVGDLGQPGLLAGESLVQVKQLQLGRSQTIIFWSGKIIQGWEAGLWRVMWVNFNAQDCKAVLTLRALQAPLKLGMMLSVVFYLVTLTWGSGRFLNCGGKTAACKGGSGVSNWGVINLRWSHEYGCQ